MKKTALISLMFVLTLAYANASGIMGNGKPITIEKTLTQFDSIRAGGKCAVNFHESEEYRAVITIDSNLEEYIDVSVRDSTLGIGIKTGFRINHTKYIVDVFCPLVKNISLSGSVQFSCIDKIRTTDIALYISGSAKINGSFECESFNAGISGSSNISGNIESNSFSADISGSSNIVLTGNAEDMNISVSGSVKFDGKDFQTKNTSIRVSGSSIISVWATNHLKAQVSGSTTVKYRGNPVIDITGSGSKRLQSI